jgi:amino acid adenylation domain-containing protein
LRTHETLTNLLRHEHAPLALAQQCSAVPAPTPLFSALLNYRYDALDQYAPDAKTAWQGIESLSSQERTNYPLTLCIDDLGDGFRMSLLAVDPLDGPRLCAYVEQALHGIADALAARPQRLLRDVAVLPAGEREALLAQSSPLPDPKNDADTNTEAQCLHTLFEAQARRTPEAIALSLDGASLTYRELNAWANRVAHTLRERGVGPDTLVALCMERGFGLVAGMLGILKAGAAYVPLDPAYPPERLCYMLEDSKPAVLLTDESLSDTLPALSGVSAMLSIGACDAAPEVDPPHVARPDHLAYVIYTSGSTGRPKGVAVTHRNVLRLFAATQAGFEFGADDVWTLFHSFAFDFSVWELWGALLAGGRLAIVPKAIAQSAEAFYALLCETGATVLNQTPSAFRQLIAAQRGSDAKHRLRHVIFGGEALEPTMLAPWYADSRNAGTRLVNMYGITETTVHVTYRPLDESDTAQSGTSPIGRTLNHLGAYLLDDTLQPVPQGVAGELYIAGAGLARGYLNRPALTAERFVPNPFGSPGTRLYRTGDLAMRLADGSLAYLGRNDEQVKIRGFRIEPGEIAAKLATHPSVDNAFVLAREDGPGGKRLVAYYTVRPHDAAEPPAADALRAHLRETLPEYMVPSAYVLLDAWPLTSNGKLDRRALPLPGADAYGRRAYEAPRGETEAALAQIWSDVLGVERVGRHDNFFELGGHSLLAISLTERMREANLHADVRALFSTPTLAALAEAVNDEPERTVVVPPNRIPSAPASKARPDTANTVELRI